MKLGTFLIELLVLTTILTKKSTCSEERIKGDALQRILQLFLKKPEYLSLDNREKQQIIIAFYYILENPNKYGDVIRTIVGKIRRKKYLNLNF